jgi:hypothetical protein
MSVLTLACLPFRLRSGAEFTSVAILLDWFFMPPNHKQFQRAVARYFTCPSGSVP